MKTATLAGTCLCLLLAGCQEAPSPLLGTLEYDSVEIRATAFETIVELPVRRGQKVSAGDIIAQLDGTSRELALATSEASLRVSKASEALVISGTRNEVIAQAQADVEAGRATLEEANRNLKRQQELREKGLVAQSVVDSALANRDNANARIAQLSARLAELRAGARTEAIDQAIAQTELSQRQVAQSREDVAMLTLRAPRSGIIDSLPLIAGDRPRVGDIVATVLTPEPYIRFYVPQNLRAEIELGDLVSIKLDGRDAQLQGTVRWISQDAAFTPFFALHAKDRGHLTYLAEADVTSSESIPAGMPAEIQIDHGR